jgi:hypothetical protein
VSADLIPGALAAGAGGTMVAGIAWREHSARERMRASRVGLGLRFPLGLEPAIAQAALDGLTGLPSTSELILEVEAREDTITHR